MRRISLAHLTVMDADPVGLVDAGAAGGFDTVGLRIVPPLPTDSIVPVVGDILMLRRIKARLAETGLGILDVEAIWLMPETNIAALLPALDLATELGARYVLTVGNDPDWSRMAQNLGLLAEACADRKLRLMLEFIPYSQVTTLAAAFRLLQDVSPKDTGLLVDAIHLSRSGGAPSDLANYDPALFSYFHLCDVPSTPPLNGLRTEAREDRLYPGEGGLWLRDFVAAFPPHTPAAIEAPSRRHAALAPADRARLAREACRRLFQTTDAGR
jgi:sugar phosphate isomerase/epimerase